MAKLFKSYLIFNAIWIPSMYPVALDMFSDGFGFSEFMILTLTGLGCIIIAEKIEKL